MFYLVVWIVNMGFTSSFLYYVTVLLLAYLVNLIKHIYELIKMDPYTCGWSRENFHVFLFNLVSWFIPFSGRSPCFKPWTWWSLCWWSSFLLLFAASSYLEIPAKTSKAQIFNIVWSWKLDLYSALGALCWPVSSQCFLVFTKTNSCLDSLNNSLYTSKFGFIEWALWKKLVLHFGNSSPYWSKKECL